MWFAHKTSTKDHEIWINNEGYSEAYKESWFSEGSWWAGASNGYYKSKLNGFLSQGCYINILCD